MDPNAPPIAPSPASPGTSPRPGTPTRGSGRRVGILLWLLALVLVVGAAGYQRMTGPTRPVRGALSVEDVEARYRLPRSGISGEAVTVRLPGELPLEAARLRWRRYPTDDAFTAVPFRRDDAHWTARIPTQPPAGKIEYRVEVSLGAGRITTLPKGGETAVLRFKDPVPAVVLVPHILMMFLSMLLGVRAALAVLAGRAEVRWLVPATALGLTLGGMILGPVVQKHAFGAYWTGWPLGEDLTDNKTLAMWAAWVVAALVLLRLRSPRRVLVRIVVLAATVVMLGVYLIPHSARGSQLDYDALEAGQDPHEAIRTGRHDGGS